MPQTSRSPLPLAPLFASILPTDGSPILAIDADWREEIGGSFTVLHVRSSRQRATSRAPFVHASPFAIPARPAAFGACLVGSTPAPLWPFARSLRDFVRPGGVIAWVVQLERAGWQRVKLMAKAPSPVRIEDLCGALLASGSLDIRTADVAGRGSRVMVWGRLVSSPPNLARFSFPLSQTSAR